MVCESGENEAARGQLALTVVAEADALCQDQAELDRAGKLAQ